MSFYSLFSFIQHLLFAVRQRLEVVFKITRWLWWCHWWTKAPCVSPLWGCAQWRNLIELLCFISPRSSPEDRITMPSLSGTKAGAMWVVSSCLPDLSLWWVSISSLLLPLWFWGERKESYTIGRLSPCSPPALYQMEVLWFCKISFFFFFLLWYSVSYVWIFMNKSDLVYTSTFLFLWLLLLLQSWRWQFEDSGRFVRDCTGFWVVREIFLALTCIALLESFSISVHVYAS